MSDLPSIGKWLIGLGVVLVVIGTLLTLVSKLPGMGDAFGWLGRLPGDILIKREHVTFYFPLATSLLVSVVLTLVFYVLSRR